MKIPPFSQQEHSHDERHFALYMQYREEYCKLLKNKKLSLQQITRIRDVLYDSMLYFSDHTDSSSHNKPQNFDRRIQMSKY